MTIFRFKLFRIKIYGSKLDFDPLIDPKIGKQNQAQELPILKKFRTNKNFKFIRIIPDELPKYFWGQNPGKTADLFIENLKKIDSQIYPQTEYIKFSDLLKNKKNLNCYAKVYKKVYDSFDPKTDRSTLVDQKMFDLEVERRSLYYTEYPLPTLAAKKLAKAAFALFAAEVAVIYKLEQLGTLSEIKILTKKDKLDLYKYEFYKVPKNRPTLPKLFVI